MKIRLLLILFLALSAACQLLPPWNDSATRPSVPPSVSIPPTFQPTLQPPVAAPLPTLAPSEKTEACQPPAAPADWRIFQAGLTKASQSDLDLLKDASLYLIHLNIPAGLEALSGCQQVHYTNREAQPLNEVYFQLIPNVSGGAIHINRAQVDGQPANIRLEQQDATLKIELAQPLRPGSRAVFTLDYEISVPRELGGTYGLFGHINNILALDTFYPTIPVYDEQGWHAGKPPSNGDNTFTDASFYLVQVQAPISLKLAASGRTIDQKMNGQNQLTTFAAGPGRDFYLAASANFAVISKQVGETTVNSYASSSRDEAARRALDAAASALEIFDKRIGPYPYTEFDVVSTPMKASGIEYPGVVGITLEFYGASRALTTLEGVTAHEAGHQWFYNVIGSNQWDEPWLDESLTQYITSVYYRDRYGESAARGYESTWSERWNRVNRSEIPIGLPSGSYTSEQYSPIVYGRGPYFVQALVAKMGEKSFSAFLQDYYRANRWGIATTGSFRMLAEKHCACNLGELFQKWVYAP